MPLRSSWRISCESGDFWATAPDDRAAQLGETEVPHVAGQQAPFQLAGISDSIAV